MKPPARHGSAMPRFCSLLITSVAASPTTQ